MPGLFDVSKEIIPVKWWALFPSPLVGEGGRDAKHRGRVRGLHEHRMCGRYPSSGASRHLLPQGEKE